MGAASSPPEADNPESNKSNVRAEARPEPPQPVEVENVLHLLILRFAEEVFSMMLFPEDCELNFLLGFRGLASANTCVDVSSPKRDDPFTCFRFSVAFSGATACATTAPFHFLGPWVIGSGRGW
jgi:hypothetical protein